MNHPALKFLLWVLVVFCAVAYLLVIRTFPSGAPDEERAKRDFLAEHPTYSIERIGPSEHLPGSEDYLIFYRVPGDSALHEELRLYLYANGQWRVSQRFHRR